MSLFSLLQRQAEGFLLAIAFEEQIFMIRLFFYVHLAGLCLLAVGLYLLFGVDNSTHEVNDILLVSVCIGLGLLLISPYPVVKAIKLDEK